MTELLIAIRPEPGCAATIEAVRAMGLSIEGFPLFHVRAVPWEAPEPSSFDALLLGSANALRHAGPALDAYRGKSAYAVGEATARAAKAAGLEIAHVGPGVLQRLIDGLTNVPQRLLRLTGAEHVPITLPADVTLTTRIVYESVSLAMPEPLATRLQRGAVVLLHSAVAARHFAAECDRLAVARDRVTLATLGPRISAAAGTGWRAIWTAAEPSEPALLALAAELCHEPREVAN